MKYKVSDTKPLSIEFRKANLDENPFGTDTYYFIVDLSEYNGGWQFIPIYVHPMIFEDIKTTENIDEKYGKIIDHIVNSYYPSDVFNATIANYLLEPDNEKYVKEFKELQKFRKLAKTYAKYVVENELI